MMKKKYSKPELIYESFTLAGATIASCTVKQNAAQIGECTVPYDPEAPNAGWYLFNMEFGACNVQPPADQLCVYDISGEQYNLFTS